jgi:hypothetical protein
VGGNEDVDGDVSGEEAAWRDLIARFDLPVDTERAQAPWPARENLTETARDRQLPDRDGTAGWEESGPAGPSRSGPSHRAGPASLPGPASLTGPVHPPGQDGWRTDPAADDPDAGRPGAGSPAGADSATGSWDTGRPGTGGPGTVSPGTVSPDVADPDGTSSEGVGRHSADRGRSGSGGTSPGENGSAAGTGQPNAGPADGARGGHRAPNGSPGHRARIVRRAGPVPRPAPPGDDQEDDDRYRPPPPEPLPKLDPVAKGAWAGLLGGPGYLLTATMLDWQVSDWAALVAIVAFIAGFAVLVLRLGDRPRDDDDDGAVV